MARRWSHRPGRNPFISSAACRCDTGPASAHGLSQQLSDQPLPQSPECHNDPSVRVHRLACRPLPAFISAAMRTAAIGNLTTFRVQSWPPVCIATGVGPALAPGGGVRSRRLQLAQRLRSHLPPPRRTTPRVAGDKKQKPKRRCPSSITRRRGDHPDPGGWATDRAKTPPEARAWPGDPAERPQYERLT